MSGKATLEDFKPLWKATLQGLIQGLENPPRGKPSASMLNTARLFLQDQGVYCEPAERQSPGNLIDLLKSLDEAEVRYKEPK